MRFLTARGFNLTASRESAKMFVNMGVVTTHAHAPGANDVCSH